MNKAIKKIELDLGGKVVSLTPQQAQNLKDALDDLFGKEVIVKREYIHDHTYIDRFIPEPVPMKPYYPIWEYNPYYNPYYWRDRVTCDIAGTGDYVDKCVLTSSCSDSGTLKLTG